MNIVSAEFIQSNVSYDKCPEPNMPEYAFVGRSNVGKSSLINMLLERKQIAKTSQTPGKTQLINHFLINGNWYLVDLPGYGFAKISKSKRSDFSKIIKDYSEYRKNLVCLFVLVDSRHKPQKNDLLFIEWLGEKQIPFSIVFTKTDKLAKLTREKNIEEYKKVLLTDWETLPGIFITSSETSLGREDILNYIEKLNAVVKF
ncbi:MAG: YihA family ribosome biogenesis GTP-binding protein [Bacteroidetes bacterium GWC2_33_15]|nr:MAG: YihA family ribosome biogenesis GTP-binding protein [Bacteroidetes bacterium GWA2_33_15]OFX51693.1 MAG: YihA family ribosome biogenesis GTP-binding protein [Bacteroidetes bacterium GWC2_33_15]OFX66245.1 MAG: YihA family ribosome biogenesis GTP-binding protein [Bacteroidetes bacterium GWB2_32_14]OFX66993.1 MAG: YihA family ribosome biogenesis GTP-binding protein [Bacteroidetes bacterium GWD2_33_33]HAN17692.1 YihA family ribosome biogenesis GTP-binding protein [Bacteroidales bacterium]